MLLFVIPVYLLFKNYNLHIFKIAGSQEHSGCKIIVSTAI